jgi:hypothetical protein
MNIYRFILCRLKILGNHLTPEEVGVLLTALAIGGRLTAEPETDLETLFLATSSTDDPARVEAMKTVFREFKENQAAVAELREREAKLLADATMMPNTASPNTMMSYSGVHSFVRQHMRVCDVIAVEIVDAEVCYDSISFN